MIVFDRVSKRYPNGREALTNVSLRIEPGEMVFLTGRSGAGKSSVLKLVALLERPTRGTVTVDGANTATLPARAIPAFRRKVGVVFQDHKLLMDRPVFDNVALPLVVTDTPLREIDRRVRAALDQVGLLGRERVLPAELSIGEQQRVGLARAVIARPPVLIADEPTGNLDHGLALEVMKLFKRFQEVGVTIVIATHDLQLVHESGQREIHIDNGQIVSGGLAAAAAARRRRALDAGGSAAGSPPRLAEPAGAPMSSPSTWAARHLQAFLGALGRLSRQPLSTLLTLVVIALALALPAGLWLFVANARAAAGGVAEAVDVTVYLKADVPLAKAQQLATQRARPQRRRRRHADHRRRGAGRVPRVLRIRRRARVAAGQSAAARAERAGRPPTRTVRSRSRR